MTVAGLEGYAPCCFSLLTLTKVEPDLSSKGVFSMGVQGYVPLPTL